jgi:hypothetical protein
MKTFKLHKIAFLGGTFTAGRTMEGQNGNREIGKRGSDDRAERGRPVGADAGINVPQTGD